MKNKFIKHLAFAFFSTTLLTSTALYAQTNDAENIDVTPDDRGTTPEELAAIYVLSEICPSYGLASNQDYKTGYEKLVNQYLPNEKNAVESLNNRAKQKSFKKYLIEARNDAKKAGDSQNQDICKEIATIK